MELEKLLNKLIEKGREPFGNYRDIITRYKYDERFFEFNHEWDNMVSIRELVSKESWLWQFVCEMSVHNNYNKEKWKILTWKKFEDDKYQINWYSNWWWYIQDYEYWLIESALKDEDELDKFLLDNIKI